MVEPTTYVRALCHYIGSLHRVTTSGHYIGSLHRVTTSGHYIGSLHVGQVIFDGVAQQIIENLGKKRFILTIVRVDSHNCVTDRQHAI